MDLLTACKKNRSRDALRLLAEDVDPNAHNRLGETPLHWAAAHGAREVVAALLQRGADPNARTTSKKAIGSGSGLATPLHFAASRPDLDIVAALLHAGADPRAADASGFSVLQAAVYSPDIRVLAKLVHAGADPNDGCLALAVRDRGPDIVAQLLALGASPHGNGESFPPLRMAYAFNRVEAAKLLTAAGARWPDAPQQPRRDA